MSKTKFRPILFSTPMVQAILEGRKTQTRRTKGLEGIDKNPNEYPSYSDFPAIDPVMNIGDVLWVRETFSHGCVENGKYTGIRFKADDVTYPVKWKPSLFMPKEACRIFLKIKSMRVERLQNISKEDAIEEGIEVTSISKKEKVEYQRYDLEPGFGTNNAIYSFETLWEKINGKGSWNKNPFVWVYEFERIDKPLDFIV
jgi:hypothetical protein